MLFWIVLAVSVLTAGGVCLGVGAFCSLSWLWMIPAVFLGAFLLQALVIFAAISLAIIIPTPNGAGPWHFVVISMMTLYGVSQTDASSFALIVHAFQTLGVMCLGAYGWVALQVRNKKRVES